MEQRAARLLTIGTAAASVYLGFQVSRLGGLAVIAALLGFRLLVRSLLPRLAHGAFARGDAGRAALYYRVLGALCIRRADRASVAVSLAACALLAGKDELAGRRLDGIEGAGLDAAARAVWLNNRAYALARQGRDLEAALEQSSEAVALRPDMAGFRHTRGLALLGLGRLDDAIRELDTAWSRGVAGASPLLEAERCFDLGVAWRRKGEGDYASDYFQRAGRAAPDSPWARRAIAELETGAHLGKHFDDYT